jgi:N-acetylglutamate synthase-like GNAT family acetyltransferase
MIDSLTIRRAKQNDLEAIAALVHKATEGTEPAQPESGLGVDAAVEPAVIQDWLLGKGVWVALRDGTLVGVAGWQVENLVSVTDVLHLAPDPSWAEVGGRLLETIEGEAMVLMCEISAVLLPSGTSPALRGLLRDQGYENAELEELHRFWQEVLGDFVESEPAIMVKQLRDRMVMVPR